MVVRILLLVCLTMILMFFASCSSKKDITREVILEKLTAQDIRAVLTEEDVRDFLENLDSSEIINKGTLLKHLTKGDVLRLLDNEDFITVFSDGKYDNDVFLLQRHPGKKCIAAHTLYVMSEVEDTDGYYSKHTSEAIVINDYVITTEVAVPDIEKLAEQLTALANSPYPPGFVPPPEDELPIDLREALDAKRNAEKIVVELEIITLLSTDRDETHYEIEILSEVFRDQDTGIVLLRRPTKYRKYVASEDCPVVLADTSLLETGPDKNYGLGIAGHNPALTNEKQVISVEYGYLLNFDRESHQFRVMGSVLRTELGGAVYVLLDGEPHLAGILNRTAAVPYGIETEAVAMDINYLIEVFKANGFDIFSPIPENIEDE